MPETSIQTPSGFNELSKAEQVHYLQALWDQMRLGDIGKPQAPAKADTNKVPPPPKDDKEAKRRAAIDQAPEQPGGQRPADQGAGGEEQGDDHAPELDREDLADGQVGRARG